MKCLRCPGAFTSIMLTIVFCSMPAFAQTTSQSAGTSTNSGTAQSSGSPANLSSGASSSDNSVFAPYVSRLRIAVKDPVVMLTWDTPTDVSGSIDIYRSTSEITSNSFTPSDKVGSVAEGTGSFVDIPPEPGKYFYAVLVNSPDSGLYRVFIPFRNVTIQPITISSTATVADLSARVSAISASSSGEVVTVRFAASRGGRTLDIYRGTAPITGSDALSRAVLIKEVSSATNSAVDYPVPGVPYYYGVFDAALVKSGDIQFSGGENATTAGVEVPLGNVRTGIPASNSTPPRATPLPYLILTQDLQSGASLAPSLATGPTPETLTPKTEAAVNAMIDGIHLATEPSPQPTILPADRQAIDRGESYTLKTILDSAFSDHDWSRAATLLQNLLTLQLDPDVRARAQFYLGQSYFFEKQYRQSFVAFLLARDTYYTDVTPWINTILREDL